VSISKRNALSAIPADLPGREELIERLAGADRVRVERIVSHGHASPVGFWYDQDETEWVMVVSGRARLRFETDDHTIDLAQGDHLTIPPHARHRVDWTDPDEPTVWIAVFF